MTSASQKTMTSNDSDDDLDLRGMFRVLWAVKWLICGITFACAVLAVVVSLLLPNIYRAEALLAPNDRERAGGLSAMASQYGGLASLAGINLGDGQADEVTLGLEILKSRKFIAEFVERHNIIVPLLAAKGWNSQTGELEIDSSDFDVESGKWTRKVRPPRKTVPSAQEAYEEFMDILAVNQDKQTGFVTVSIEHYSPEVARQWVDWIVDDLNSSIMRQDVAEAEQAITYLNNQIKNTSLAELQSIFFNLIEEQMKTVMLAKVTDEYLLKTIDPAIAPEKKAKPQRFLIVVLSAMLGFFLSAASVLMFAPMRVASSNRDKY
jgi:uncharacterized protein involved in exopolysaccharide biosynthesis